MSDEKGNGDQISANISGDVSGQVAVGKGISQIQNSGSDRPEEIPADPDDLSRLSRLREIIATRFDEGELRTLCFDLGLDYDDLPARGKANKARELVSFLQRHGRVAELLQVGQRLRPDISWEEGEAASDGTRA